MQKKVLLVENNDDVRDYMKILLELYDYQVLEAVDGNEAVSSAQTNSPDLILMDLSMPNMDGLVATKIIRKFEASTEVPIIAVTAFSHFYTKPAFEVGCNDLITKPISFKELDKVLKRYLTVTV